MPYRRQYRRRSYRPRRQSRSSRYLDTASKALAVAYSVKKLLNVEFRHHEAEVTINPSTSGLVSNLSLVAQGDASTQREGNSFRAKSLTLRGTDTANSSATSPTVVRHIIFQDLQQQGTAPTPSNVLKALNVNSNLNIVDFPKRFKVLRDWTTDLSTVSAGRGNQSYKYHIKLDSVLKYDGPGGTAAEQRYGQLYHLTLSNQSTNTPTCSLYHRLRFVDN